MSDNHDTATAKPLVHRRDYAPPAFWIDTVNLTFDLDPAKTRVLNVMTMRRNPDAPAITVRLNRIDQ